MNTTKSNYSKHTVKSYNHDVNASMGKALKFEVTIQFQSSWMVTYFKAVMSKRNNLEEEPQSRQQSV